MEKQLPPGMEEGAKVMNEFLSAKESAERMAAEQVSERMAEAAVLHTVPSNLKDFLNRKTAASSVGATPGE